jgi:uncharacterized protein YkwD
MRTIASTLLAVAMLLGRAADTLAATLPNSPRQESSEVRPRVYIVAAMNGESRSVPPAQLSFEEQVIDLINQERARAGLAALNSDARLIVSARKHSQDMADRGFFSHTGSNGSNPGQRMSAAGYTWRTYAENIAAGYPTPENVMRGWMDSPGHRANILSKDVRDVGVGYVVQTGTEWTHYWTTNFGTN